MVSNNALFDEFIKSHRWGILTHLKNSGAPASSVVAYAVEGASMVVSTPGKTFKRRALERDPRVNLCVINNQEPFNFVSVEGVVTVETEQLEASTRLVFENIQAVGYALPEDLGQWLKASERVILRIQPEHFHGVIRAA
ncbi:MAG: pyridoxamine 5'-phosphate oxidase family protein [Pseudomonadales bacterium]|jgi:PPOX class probable F420-dependent enzyme|tara:strand:+ start:4816 stop:5232 length:417 start_codon:yes stop_codon:yes gene_type:complete